MLANSEDNSDTGDLELIQHLNVTSSSLKILLQGTKKKTEGWKKERVGGRIDGRKEERKGRRKDGWMEERKNR